MNTLIYHGRNKPKNGIKQPPKFTIGFHYIKESHELVCAYSVCHKEDKYNKKLGIDNVISKINYGETIISEYNEINHSVRKNFLYYLDKAVKYFNIKDMYFLIIMDH